MQSIFQNDSFDLLYDFLGQKSKLTAVKEFVREINDMYYDSNLSGNMSSYYVVVFISLSAPVVDLLTFKKSILHIDCFSINNYVLYHRLWIELKDGATEFYGFQKRCDVAALSTNFHSVGVKAITSSDTNRLPLKSCLAIINELTAEPLSPIGQYYLSIYYLAFMTNAFPIYKFDLFGKAYLNLFVDGNLRKKTDVLSSYKTDEALLYVQTMFAFDRLFDTGLTIEVKMNEFTNNPETWRGYNYLYFHTESLLKALASKGSLFDRFKEFCCCLLYTGSGVYNRQTRHLGQKMGRFNEIFDKGQHVTPVICDITAENEAIVYAKERAIIYVVRLFDTHILSNKSAGELIPPILVNSPQSAVTLGVLVLYRIFLSFQVTPPRRLTRNGPAAAKEGTF